MDEIWKETEHSGYWVSNLGRVQNRNIKQNGHSSNNFIGSKTPKGYMNCSLNGKPMFIHRLVATAFVDGNNSLGVNHKNGIKDDNRVENLEWATQKENIIHCRDILKRKFVNGSKHGRSKLKIEDIIEIRILKMSGMLQCNIAKAKSISMAQVSRILTKKRWSHYE